MNYNTIFSIWMCSSMLLTLAQSPPSSLCPNGICPGLGNGFALWQINTAGDILTATQGFKIFQNTSLGYCVTYNQQGDNERTFVVSTSMESFTQNIMTDNSLTVSGITAGYSAKATVQVLTSQSSTMTTTFTGVQMDIKMTSSTLSFNQNSQCLGEENFDPDFFQDFQSLPVMADPTNSADWTPYVNFMSKWGSHVMIQQDIGSRFQQWLSSTSEDSTTATTLQVKGCAEVEGMDPVGGWSVSSCAGYSQSQKQEAMNTESTDYRIITGGTDDTRAALTENITEASLDAFIASAPAGDQPISYSFDAIWDIIYFIYNDECTDSNSPACVNVQRATTLEAAYEAWLALGCQTQTDGNGQTYQTMTQQSDSRGIQTYQCTVSKTGCRTDNDCHVGGVGEVCYCYGPGCITQGDSIPLVNNYRDAVQGSETGSYDEGVNNSCYYHTWKFECDCTTDWSGGLPNRQIYTQSSP